MMFESALKVAQELANLSHRTMYVANSLAPDNIDEVPMLGGWRGSYYVRPDPLGDVYTVVPE